MSSTNDKDNNNDNNKEEQEEPYQKTNIVVSSSPLHLTAPSSTPRRKMSASARTLLQLPVCICWWLLLNGKTRFLGKILLFAFSPLLLIFFAHFSHTVNRTDRYPTHTCCAACMQPFMMDFISFFVAVLSYTIISNWQERMDWVRRPYQPRFHHG